MARRRGYTRLAVAAVALAVAWLGAQAESHVRIIRLSYVDGHVQMDRATGQGLERAILNTPITEGVRIATGSNGLAEVEFENNTSVRLGENSEVRFSKLLVNDAGAKVNEMTVTKGTVYVETKSNKDDIYRVAIDNSTFLIHRDTQMRLSDEDGELSAAVMKGEALLENQPQEVKIKKKETLTLAPNNPAGYEIAKGVEAGPLDRWNNERSAYQTAYSYDSTGYMMKNAGFGYADLSYYGGWTYLPGIGPAWQPYGLSSWMGWDPYTAGAWMYSSLGYTWASAYPWGWLPYHYGAWQYAGNGAGWFWVPGAATGNLYSTGFQTVPVVHGPAGWRPPTTAPVATSVEAYRPTVKVGMIGNLPAVIPGGRIPPNFRSVVPRSSFMSPAAAARGMQGTSSALAKNAPVNSRGNSNVFDSPQPNVARGNGHVFAMPRPMAATVPQIGNPAANSGGFGGGYGSGRAGGMSSVGAAPVSGRAGGSGRASGGAVHGSPK